MLLTKCDSQSGFEVILFETPIKHVHHDPLQAIIDLWLVLFYKINNTRN